MKRTQSITKNRAAKPSKSATKTKVRVSGGIDVGKTWLDAAIHKASGKFLRQPNTPQGRSAIVGFFFEHEVTRVGVEASGSYEFEMVDAMREAGLEVIVFQPGSGARLCDVPEASRQD